jgi:hypothetical protein
VRSPRILHLVLSCLLWLLANAPADAHASQQHTRANALPYWTYKSFTIAAASQDDLFGSGPSLRAMKALR